MATFVTASSTTALSTELPATTPVPPMGTTSLTTFVPVVTSMDAESRLKVYTIDSLPSECSSRWVLYTYSSDTPIITSGNYEETVMGTTLAPGYWRSCYPDAPVTPNYSPAMCTGRYSLINPTHTIVQGPMQTTQWTATCCPKGMVYLNRCQSIFSTTIAVSLVVPPYSTSNPESLPTIWSLGAGIAWAEPITVHWQSSDLSRFPSIYATSLASYMGVTIEAPPPDPSWFLSKLPGVGEPLPTNEPSELSMSGTPKGVIIGFSVGAFAGLGLLSGVIIYWLRRRRRKHHAFATEHGLATELSNHSTGLRSWIRGRWRAEMDGREAPVEIDSKNIHTPSGPIAELEAPVHHPDKDPDQFSFTGSNFETRRVDEEKEEKGVEAASSEKKEPA